MALPGQVHPDFHFIDDSMPKDFGINFRLEDLFRVYVIECRGGKLYSGLETKWELARRLRDHFDPATDACHFTTENPPTRILYVHPAACRAMEALVFYRLLADLPGGSAANFNALGGWVQTASKVSPLRRMTFEEERRQLVNTCFKCDGGFHTAKSCQKPHNNFREYWCTVCKVCCIRVFSNGRSEENAAVTAAGISAASSGSVAAAPPPPHPAPPILPLSEPPPAQQPPQAPPQAPQAPQAPPAQEAQQPPAQASVESRWQSFIGPFESVDRNWFKLAPLLKALREQGKSCNENQAKRYVDAESKQCWKKRSGGYPVHGADWKHVPGKGRKMGSGAGPIYVKLSFFKDVWHRKFA